MKTLAELLAHANQGPIELAGGKVQVRTHKDKDGDDVLSVTLKALNQHTTDAYIVGSCWLSAFKDEDVPGFLADIAKNVATMHRQAEIAGGDKPRILKGAPDLGSDKTYLRGDNKRVYVLQQYVKGDYAHFTICSTNKWQGGYEEDCPINIPIVLDGIAYQPYYSFWLGHAVYKGVYPNG